MRCDAMRCDAMRCDAMRCDAMRCDAMGWDAMRCDAKRDESGRDSGMRSNREFRQTRFQLPSRYLEKGLILRFRSNNFDVMSSGRSILMTPPRLPPLSSCGCSVSSRTAIVPLPRSRLRQGKGRRGVRAAGQFAYMAHPQSTS